MPHNLRQLSLFGAPVELDGEVAADEPLPPSLQVRGQTNLFGAEEPVGSPSRGAASANQPTEAPPSAPRPATRSAAERATALAQLAQEAVGCRRCPLREGARQVVFGEGNPDATLMLVGEGPGAQEDLEGRPFVGRAGQLLDKMLAAIGIAREEVYIANVVKCRPPGNRVPTPAEQDACFPYLQQQIELVQPEIILCLGATAARRLIDPRFSVTRSHGVWYEREGRRVIATFHPAALLRDPGKKRLAWDDLQKVQAVYFGREG
ncbi:uracil-DNA glycosylase [Limnochorda sp.]|uniref:uracil-DNA glycosylase n=1 Tax=Limnochorda sp. TaxID=1940279 RepID=UPI001839A306|nr:uracil-DNA glycosylase [Bacillota bacterium]MBO2518861.1 uracil-DNA glycosylase [Bacillota bacterium]NMA71396.1 uracil-DNA glycosylase [Bacillota bacterium]